MEAFNPSSPCFPVSRLFGDMDQSCPLYRILKQPWLVLATDLWWLTLQSFSYQSRPNVRAGHSRAVISRFLDFLISLMYMNHVEDVHEFYRSYRLFQTSSLDSALGAFCQ